MKENHHKRLFQILLLFGLYTFQTSHLAQAQNASNTDLQIAVDSNQVEQITQLLKQSPEKNPSIKIIFDELEENWALSKWAAYKGHIEILKLLEDRGVDLTKADPADPLAETPLMLAAGAGHGSIVQFLLDKGADPNLKDSNFQSTALMKAASKGHMSIVNMLLTKGSSINVQNDWGGTALTFAASNGHLEVVNTLIAKGADIHLKIQSGETALELAINQGHFKLAEKLLQVGANIDHKDKYGMTLLMYAAVDGNFARFKFLIDHGANPKMLRDEYGHTVLMHAAMGGNLEIVKWLLSQGADPNFVDKTYSNSALIIAVANESPQIVSLLLQAGAQINTQNTDGTTALLQSIYNAMQHVYSLEHSETSLQKYKDNLQIAQLLLQYQANKSIKDNKNQTALDYANQLNMTEFIELLKQEPLLPG